MSLYFHRFSIKKNALDGHNEDTSLFLCKILFVVHIKVINETFFGREVFPKKEASFPKTTLQVRYNSILRFAIASVTYHLSCFSIRKIIVNSLQIQLYFQFIPFNWQCELQLPGLNHNNRQISKITRFCISFLIFMDFWLLLRVGQLQPCISFFCFCLQST